MRQLQVNDYVRVIHGIPNDFLPAGTVGVIQSIWGKPTPDYEVEFRLPGTDEILREVVEADQVEWVGNATPLPDTTSCGAAQERRRAAMEDSVMKLAIGRLPRI